MKRPKIIVGIILLAILFFAAAVTVVVVSDDFRSGTAASDVAQFNASDNSSSFTTIDGVPVELSEIQADVLVVNSWATWCPFCVQELPDLDKLPAAFPDAEIVVVAINRAESPQTVEAFIRHVGDPNSIMFLLDPSDRFYDGIGGFAMPETIFYDRSGSIAFHKHGHMSFEEMRSHVSKALDTNADS